MRGQSSLVGAGPGSGSGGVGGGAAPAGQFSELDDSGERVSWVRLARKHALDWALVGVMIAALALTQFTPVFESIILPEDMYKYKYPLLPNTIPSAFVPVIALGAPAAVASLWFLFTRSKRDLHTALLTACVAVLLNGVITNLLKQLVGMPRPDFYYRCFQGIDVAYTADGKPACNGPSLVVKEGYRSFPSGHVSWSTTGLFLCSLHIAGKLHVFSSGVERRLPSLLAAFLPLLGAIVIACTRMQDYWHRANDVLGGGVLGLLVPYVVYHQYYPPLTDEKSDLPLSIHKVSQGMMPLRQYHDNDIERAYSGAI